MEGVNQEVYIFLCFLLSGGICGVVFDLFRAIRKVTKSPDWFIYSQDVLFWIFVAAIAMFTSYHKDAGVIRIYMFWSMFLGGSIYFFLFSKITYKVLVDFCRLIKTIVGYAFLPLKKSFQFIYSKTKQMGKYFHGRITKSTTSHTD